MDWKVLEVMSPHQGPISVEFKARVKTHAAEMLGERRMVIRFSCGVDLVGDLTNPETDTDMISDIDAVVCPQCGAPWMAMRRA